MRNQTGKKRDQELKVVFSEEGKIERKWHI